MKISKIFEQALQRMVRHHSKFFTKKKYAKGVLTRGILPVKHESWINI
jgi:hypothetical protein